MSLRLIDDDTGDDYLITMDDWEELQKLADEETEVKLPNSSKPLSDFFDNLLKTLENAINRDIRNSGRRRAEQDEKILYSSKPQIIEAFETALRKLDSLSPSELRKAKALGELYLRPEAEAVQKQSAEDVSVEDAASLVETVSKRATDAYNKNSVTLS